jgi:hypothetical protein
MQTPSAFTPVDLARVRSVGSPNVAFVLQFTLARGRWASACADHEGYVFPRNAWSARAVRVIAERRA